MARVKKEVKEEKIDLTDIKDELQVYIDKEIKKGFKGEIDKLNRKVINEKNKKIYFRDIIIVLLLLLIVYLLYLMNEADYFDKYFISNNSTNIVENNNNNKINEEKEVIIKEPTLEELKSKYQYLLNNIVISENCNYKDDYYNGNLSTNLKKYITLSNFDFESLVIDDYSIINADDFKIEYNKLFDGEYTNDSFDYNVNKIRYIEKLNSYITNSILIKDISNIKREIINIEVNNNDIVITTVEGVVKDNKLYNVVTLNEVKNYKNDNISNYKDSLNIVKYVFKDNKLIDIE